MTYIFLISFFLFVFIIAITIFQRYKAIKNPENKSQNSRVIDLSDEDFQETIKTGVTLVDFWAPWCGPCRNQNPVIEKIADEVGEAAKICKINVDEHKKAAVQMKIKNIPNIIIFKDGDAVKQLIGAKPKHVILMALKPLIEMPAN
jgi:thioredoxin 1